MILSILNPPQMLAAASDSLALWARRVVPALLPFLFAVQGLLLCGADKYASVLLRPLVRLLGYPNGGFPLVVSLLTGYPAGARVLREMHSCGRLSDDECACLSVLCHTSGPFFVLGYVAGVTGCGTEILLCHYLSVFCTAAFFSLFHRPTPNAVIPHEAVMPPIGELIIKSASSSVSSLLSICACMVFFGCVSSLSDNPFVSGMLEMTAGIAALPPSPFRPATACAFISFSGLSVIAQALSFLPKRIKPTKFIGARLMCGVLSFILCSAANLTAIYVSIAAGVLLLILCAAARRIIWKTVPSRV